jgi:hypothetical protein
MVSTFSKLSTWVSGAVMATTVFAAAMPAHSAAITGTLGFSGTLTATSTSFDFLPAGGGTGDFAISQFAAANTGFFSGLTNTAGLIRDFTSATLPINTPVTFTNFLTFAAAPTVSFTVTRLPSGTTSPLIPTTFTQNGTNVTAAFSVIGFFVDSTAPAVQYAGGGSFTTQIPDTTVAAVLATLGSGGSFSPVYSATFTSVPEPDVLPSVLGLGMVLSGAVAVRRRIATAK